MDVRCRSCCICEGLAHITLCLEVFHSNRSKAMPNQSKADKGISLFHSLLPCSLGAWFGARADWLRTHIRRLRSLNKSSAVKIVAFDIIKSLWHVTSSPCPCIVFVSMEQIQVFWIATNRVTESRVFLGSVLLTNFAHFHILNLLLVKSLFQCCHLLWLEGLNLTTWTTILGNFFKKLLHTALEREDASEARGSEVVQKWRRDFLNQAVVAERWHR